MRLWTKSFYFAHLLLAVFIFTIVFLPNQRATAGDYVSLLVAVGIIEAIFLLTVRGRQKKDAAGTGSCDIMIFIWLVFIAWELATSTYNVAHPVLIPSPENVFRTFVEQWQKMLLNVFYSMQLLLIGFFLGLVVAVILGLFAGWIPRIKNFAYPIANIMAPIPAIVFSPYLVALMPSFRGASIAVIVLGVFWPTFLTTVNRISSIEPQILDSARMLCLGNMTMIWKVLLPYIFPGVVSGLKVSMTTSLLMLNYAELMGATHGMGYYVQNSITYANYTHAVAGIIVIGVVVTILSVIITKIQANIIKWR
jgi:NitT/TauT family transport system permease protein